MTKSRKVPDIPISHAPTLRGQEWPVAGVLDSTGLQNQELRVITGPSCSAGWCWEGSLPSMAKH